MSELPSVFSTDRPIQHEHITFVVDTNILIEFDSISQIDWRLLCPSARSIKIVVPKTVVREMDGHKQSAPRIRRRALEFNKYLIKIEDGNGQDTALDSTHVSLTLVLMELYAQQDLPQGKLSFTVNDDLIVAEAVRFNQDNSDAIFLNDDTNARRTAREMGINVARPPEEWRRKEPRDERDTRIEELERQLGALPRLSSSLVMVGTDEVTFQTLHSKAIPDGFFDRVAELFLENNPGHSRDTLLRRHGLSASQRNFRISVPSPFSVSMDAIDKYLRNYQKFKRQVATWSQRVPDILNKVNFAVPLVIEIGNDGEAFANHVRVIISASNGYGFIPNQCIRPYFEFRFNPPEPPAPVNFSPHIPNLFEQQKQHGRDPFSFYIEDTPDADGSTANISFDCERLRHSSSAILSNILLKKENSPSGGLINVQASSASLADSLEAKYPIRARQGERSEDFKGYLQQRLLFFPWGIQNAIAAALDDF